MHVLLVHGARMLRTGVSRLIAYLVTFFHQSFNTADYVADADFFLDNIHIGFTLCIFKTSFGKIRGKSDNSPAVSVVRFRISNSK